MPIRKCIIGAVIAAAICLGPTLAVQPASADDLFSLGKKLIKKKLRVIEKQVGKSKRMTQKARRGGYRTTRRSRTSRVTTVAASAAPALSMRDYEKLYDSYFAVYADQERDVDAAIVAFIDKLKIEHEALWANARSKAEVANLDEINAITEVDIRQSLDAAYLTNKLVAFDAFSAELWTRERLLVQVLREAMHRIEPYFDGVGAKGPTRQDVETVLSQAAGAIYTRAFEVNELLGLAQSFDRFSRTIYERTDEADLQLASSAQKFAAAEDHFESFVSRELEITRRKQAEAIQLALMQTSPDEQTVEKVDMVDHEFIVRYRARRVLFDCLDRGYAEIIEPAGDAAGKTSETALASSTDGSNAADTSAANAQPANRTVVSSVESEPGLGQKVNAYMRSVCSPSIGQLVNDEIAPIPARSQIAGIVAQVDGRTIRTSTDADEAQDSE
jgi:hypothetical protein